MNIGMMWRSDKPLRQSVSEAVAYYQKKYGRLPDAAYVNPKLLDEHEMIVDGISVKPMRIPLTLLWIGVEDAAAGIERESLQLIEQAEQVKASQLTMFEVAQ